MNLFNYVSVIPQCVSKELCDLFINLPKDISPATTGYTNKETVNLDARITNWIAIPEELRLNTVNSITALYNNKLINTYKKSIMSIEPPQLLHYNIGGKYEKHNDSEDLINGKLARVCERDVTILIYLNDNYTGGELEFPDWGCTFRPKAGTLIAFPSYIEFTHRVHPVQSGERYTIVSWINTNERIYNRPYIQ